MYAYGILTAFRIKETLPKQETEPQLALKKSKPCIQGYKHRFFPDVVDRIAREKPTAYI